MRVILPCASSLARFATLPRSRAYRVDASARGPFLVFFREASIGCKRCGNKNATNALIAQLVSLHSPEERAISVRFRVKAYAWVAQLIEAGPFSGSTVVV